MDIKVEDISEDERFATIQDELMNNICIIPDNFIKEINFENYTHSSTLPTVKKVIKNPVPLKIINETGRYIELRNNEWLGPIFVIGAAFYSQNPTLTSIALGMLANYLTDYFKGQDNNIVKMKVFVRDEERKITKLIQYEGPIEGLGKIDGIVKKIIEGK